MKTRTAPKSLVASARVAAILYLLPLAPFSLLYIPGRLIVPGDIAATINNILASESLFRLGIVSNLISQISFVFVALVLYQVLKPVNKHVALLMLVLNLSAFQLSCSMRLITLPSCSCCTAPIRRSS